jgi:nitrogen regulatory protein PII
MFHPAVKLIVITEDFVRRKVCDIIEAAGAKGYTLVQAGGKGLHHFHATSDQASVVEEFTNIKIEVVCRDRARAEQIADRLMAECFHKYPGVMYLEQVEIQRLERF